MATLAHFYNFVSGEFYQIEKVDMKTLLNEKDNSNVKRMHVKSVFILLISSQKKT